MAQPPSSVSLNNIPLCLHSPHFLCPFNHWWGLRLCSYLFYCGYCLSKHGWYFFEILISMPLDEYPEAELLDRAMSFIFNFLKELWYCFPQCLHQFKVPSNCAQSFYSTRSSRIHMQAYLDALCQEHWALLQNCLIHLCGYPKAWEDIFLKHVWCSLSL